MTNRRASIDIGSNSILLLAGEFQNGSYRELLNESYVTGLGRHLDKNMKFLDEAMDESFLVLEKYVELVIQIGLDPSEVIVTATEAARVASNAKEFIFRVKNELGLNIKIISAAGEAYFSSKGILFNTKFKEEKICIMDIGGASTEIIEVTPADSKVVNDFSLPLGAVRVTNWIEEGILEEKLTQIYAQFKNNLDLIRASKLYCVAGTMTSVANMYLGNKNFQENDIHGLSFKTSEVVKMLKDLGHLNSEEFLKRFPFLGKRARTIKGGMIVATTVFHWLDVEDVAISTFGLRYGTLEQGDIPDEYLN